MASPISNSHSRLSTLAAPTRHLTFAPTTPVLTNPSTRLATHPAYCPTRPAHPIPAPKPHSRRPLAMALPPGVTRSGIPLLVKDIVTIKDPDLIRKVTAHPDIGRPAETDLPALFRVYFAATKFIYPPTGRFVVPLEGNDRNSRPARRAVIEDQLSKGFTEAHIEKLVALVRGKEEFPRVAAECAKIIADLILPLPEGESLPDDVAQAAFYTLVEFPDFFNPFKYLRGRSSRKKVEDYCRSLLPDEEFFYDYSHNLGAAGQGLGHAVMTMRNMSSPDVGEHFADNPITLSVLRVPTQTTTLDGAFPDDAPLLENGTIIILDIGSAATQSRDDKFLFGSGVEFRQCPFKGLFFETTTEVQKRTSSSS